MSDRVTVALDAMGGDHGVEAVIAGADLALKKLLNEGVEIFYKIYALESAVDKLFDSHPLVQQNSEVFFVDDVVLADDKPAIAVRKRKNSSMYQAVTSVKTSHADCVVSAGNTGALMAISKILLGMLPNILRPAIITTIPTRKKELVVLDLGANLDCNSDILFQFAYMGAAFGKAVLEEENPRVALLNIGTEENKGTDTIKEAWHLLHEHENGINFVGYAEPEQMLSGDIDVIVTDGFNGNIMLKTAESIYYLVKESVVNVLGNSILGWIFSVFLRRSLEKSMHKFNPKLRNGAMLIGLNGIVIKAHGSSDSVSFANAIEVAVHAVHNKINSQIVKNIESIE